MIHPGTREEQSFLLSELDTGRYLDYRFDARAVGSTVRIGYDLWWVREVVDIETPGFPHDQRITVVWKEMAMLSWSWPIEGK